MGPLFYVAIDIFGALLETTNENQHFAIVADRLSKWTRALLTAKIQFDANCDNILGQLGYAIWDTVIRIGRQWTPICKQLLHNPLPSFLGK